MTRTAFVLAGAVMISGCAAIPSSGSVNHYANQVGANNATSSASTEATGPQPGASKEEIIRGFLHAGAGAGDNFAVAQQYLTSDMADRWKPDESTLVYSSNFSVQPSSDRQLSVTVPKTAQIDSQGIATSFSSVSDEKLEFSLVLQDGEWRISSAPQGLVLSQNEFNKDFGPYTLYFYDPSYNYLVPDVRWLANRAATVTSLVRLTFEGPAPYLKSAVLNASNRGISLSRNSVPVNNGEAEINLSGESSSGISQTEINRIDAQLKQTLTGVLGIETTKLSIDEKVVPADSNYSPAIAKPSLPEQVIGISNQGVHLLEDAETDKKLEVYSTPSPIVNPAISYSTNHFAALNEQKTQMLLGDAESSAWVLSGNQLTRPSFDQYSWVWTADSEGSVQAVSVDQPEKSIAMDADWLKGIAITSFNLSRDGTRAVITGESNGQSQIWVSGVVRDQETFQPKNLGEPVRIGSGKNSIADWLNDSQIIMGDTSNGSISVVSLSGEKENLIQLQNLSTINAGIGEDEIIATDTDQNTYKWSGTDWVKINNSYTGLNYSG